MPKLPAPHEPGIQSIIEAVVSGDGNTFKIRPNKVKPKTPAVINRLPQFKENFSFEASLVI